LSNTYAIDLNIKHIHTENDSIYLPDLAVYHSNKGRPADKKRKSSREIFPVRTSLITLSAINQSLTLYILHSMVLLGAPPKPVEL
jgi:hypothetical protein